MKHRNGDLIWLECKFFRNIELDPERKLIIGVFKDITNQKSCEQFLWKNLEENIGSINRLRKIKRKYKYKVKYNNNLNESHFYKVRNKFPLLINEKIKLITEREKEILELIASGYSSKQIAARLKISYHTVVRHRSNLLSKLGVHNSVELIKEISDSLLI